MRRDYLTEPADHGTPERALHGGIVFHETDAAGVMAAWVKEECVLDRYLNRMQLVDRQHAAGHRLRSLWLRASHPPATTSSYGEQRGRGDGDLASTAREALRKALMGSGLGKVGQNVPVLVVSSKGQEIWPVTLPLHLTPAGHVTISVCGLDEWAGGTRRLTMLREGLTALADHWKI